MRAELELSHPLVMSEVALGCHYLQMFNSNDESILHRRGGLLKYSQYNYDNS